MKKKKQRPAQMKKYWEKTEDKKTEGPSHEIDWTGPM